MTRLRYGILGMYLGVAACGPGEAQWTQSPQDEVQATSPGALAAVGAPSVRASVFATSAGTGTLALTRPLNTAPGDLLVALVTTQMTGGSLTRTVAPAGWVELTTASVKSGDQGSGASRLQAFWRFAGTAEPGAYTFSESGGTFSMAGALLAIAGANASAPVIAVSKGRSTVYAPWCTAPSLTTTVANALLLFGCAVPSTSGRTLTAPSGQTELGDVTSGGTYKSTLEVAAGVRLAPGSTADASARLNMDAVSAAMMIAIAPSATAPSSDAGTSVQDAGNGGGPSGGPDAGGVPDAGTGTGGGVDAGTGGNPGAGSGDAGSPAPSCGDLGAPAQTGGKTWVVSPTGLDSNPGTASAPLRTVGRAAGLVNPGDTVVVEDGTYGEFDIGRGGTSTNWVWIKARNRGRARIVSANPTGIHVLSVVGFLRLEGFDVSGMRRDTDSGSAEALYVEGHDLQVIGNRVHDVRGCTSTTNGLVGAYNSGQNNLYEANVFYDIGRWKNEMGCSKPDSFAHDHGIYVSSSGGASNGTKIRNNVFYDIKRGFGVQLYPGAMSNVSVVNNTFAFGNPDHEGQIILGASFSNTEIRNNVFYQPNGAAIQVYQFSGALTVANNLTTASAATSRVLSGMIVTANQLGRDPLFVNPALRDLHLSPASPAIDVGEARSEITFDADGCSRPRGAGYDLGAFER